jgi:hypothetical protein
MRFLLGFITGVAVCCYLGVKEQEKKTPPVQPAPNEPAEPKE